MESFKMNKSEKDRNWLNMEKARLIKSIFYQHRLAVISLIIILMFSNTNAQITAFLSSPFEGEYSLLATFDHEYPIYSNSQGTILTYWGERIILAYDGHKGYDWALPKGSPVYAAADGIVTFAGQTEASICPSQNRRIAGGVLIEIEHTIGNSEFLTSYLHLERVLVNQGAGVSAGQIIAYSGQTGTCVGPHLHFELDKLVKGRWISVDPYGWQASFSDPWQLHPEGTASSYLWKQGRAPELFRESEYNINQNNIPVVVKKIRSIGVFDNLYPNNEFFEIEIPSRYRRNYVNLTGYSISNNFGEVFSFADGIRLEPNQTIRIYSGYGQNTTNTLYWQSPKELWGNSGFCLTIRDNYQHIIGTYRHKMPKSACR